MIRTFLKAKHWQLFVTLIGIPVIFYIIMMGSFISKISEINNTSSDDHEAMLLSMFGFMRFLPIIMILYLAIFFGWFWSIAIGLQDKIPKGITMKVKRFKILFFIPLIYFMLLFIGLSFIFSQIPNLNAAPDYQPNFKIFAGLIFLIVPLHLFSIFCMIHNLYFVAKTFKTVELQKEVTFSDFIGEFFMFWFYFIGVWFVQPKINKMIEEENQLN